MPRSFLLLCFLQIAGSAAAAQSPPPRAVPFGTVAVSAGILADVAGSANLDAWASSPGFELRALLPFYAGSVELGASQSSFASLAEGVPGFRARYAFVGWGVDARPVSRLTWRTGARLGIYDLQFDDESIPDYARSENEIGTELVTEVGLGLGGRWSVVAGAGGRVVFTDPRLRQLTFSAAIRRTFVSPEWLRDFLD